MGHASFSNCLGEVGIYCEKEYFLRERIPARSIEEKELSDSVDNIDHHLHESSSYTLMLLWV